MTDRHKHQPIPFRPTPEGNRLWLQEHAKRTGKAVNAILNAALTAYREHHDSAMTANCGYCRGQRTGCNCTKDCGARAGEFTGAHCPKAIGYLDWLRSEGYPEDRLERLTSQDTSQPEEIQR